MTQFRYEALDPEGNAANGAIEAPSAHQATVRLQERGLTVNKVEPLHPEKGLLRLVKRLSWEELELLTLQLSSLAKSNLPLAPALKSLAADLRNPRLKPVLDQLQKDLEAGETLEDAVLRQHKSFPPIYPPLLRAGEASGNLAGVLQLLCDHAGRMASLKYNVQAVFAYPATVIAFVFLILGFLVVKVVPVFADIFSDFGASLPAPTRLVLRLGDTLIYDWPSILLAICVCIIVLHIIKRVIAASESGRCWLDAAWMHFPGAGRMYRLSVLIRFCRTLPLLLQSRVPILDSLELAAASSGSPLLERAVNEVALRVAGGDTMSSSLADTKVFNRTFCWLVSVGEGRGDLEQTFDHLAAGYERELRVCDRRFGAFMAPALVVSIAVVIGFLVISLYLPIFSLGDSLSG